MKTKDTWSLGQIYQRPSRFGDRKYSLQPLQLP
jgi:hypothetical protein